MSNEITMEEKLQRYEDAIDTARKRMTKLGLKDRGRPYNEDGSAYDGFLPDDIDKASLHEIKEELVKMNAFLGYVKGLNQQAKEELSSAQQKLNTVKGAIRKKKIGSKEEREDATINDIEFINANAEYLTKLYSCEKIELRVEMATKAINILSRLITAEQVSNDTGRKIAHVNRGGNTDKRRFTSGRGRN